MKRAFFFEEAADAAETTAIRLHKQGEVTESYGAYEVMHTLRRITSRGRDATQSVFHLHLHLAPRAENDGLAPPWYSGHSRKVGA